MATASSTENDETAEVLAKPPFLRRVRIRGYKSIAFCDVTLEPLTILVGRNASGKSNFLDALAFLRDGVRFNLPEALERHGGFQSMLCRSVATNEFAIGIKAAYRTPSGSDYEADYNLIMPPSAGPGASSHSETLFIHDVSGSHCEGFEFIGGKARIFSSLAPQEDPVKSPGAAGSSQPSDGLAAGSGQHFIMAPGDSSKINLERIRLPGGQLAFVMVLNDLQIPTGRLALSMAGKAGGVAFTEALASMGFYNFNPDAIRVLRKPNSSWLMEKDGRNLASVIEGLKHIDPDSVQRVRQYLSAITEQVEGFDAVRYGEYETVRFRLNSRSGAAPLEFDAASMSDGTLRALAALVAVFQNIRAHDSPSLVAVEEPEVALHPGAMRALVAALDEATLRTQVLLTTHSPDLLDVEEVKPENVRVVQMIDGQTIIGPVDEASVEIVRRKLNTLGGLERDDRLEPDLDDRDRQQVLQQAREGSPV